MTAQQIAKTGEVRVVDVRSALSRQAPPAGASALSVSLTFAWRGLLKIKHVPEQMADVILIPVMFTLIFTYLFGGALSGSTGDYLHYVLPGTLVMAVLLVTVYTGITLNTDISTGVFDRFRSLPVWRPAMILGGLFGDVGRYALASLIVVALGLAMGFRPEGGVVGVLAGVALVLLFAFSLSWMWTALGLVMRTPVAVQVVSLVPLFLLTFTSNVFVDPETTPSWLQTAIDLNPVTHLVTAVRGLMYGDASASEIGWVLAASAALVAVFAPLTMRLYGRKQ